MNILHLSDTQLSGSCQRISALLTKYGGVESKHYVWRTRVGFREFPVDLCPMNTSLEEMRYLIYEWADVINYHNRWKRQEIFQALGTPPPDTPSVIQMHSPRESENFKEELASGIPIAVVAQYQVRQWDELRYIVPNVVDIRDPLYISDRPPYMTTLSPVVSYAPSNTNSRGWDDKSYGSVNPVLKRMRLKGEIYYDLIQQKPFLDTMALKHRADIGIDEIVSGSYHLSALEYLALGVPCFCNVDDKTEKVLKDLTGCTTMPFLKANKYSFERELRRIIKGQLWCVLGLDARDWMAKYWNPEVLCEHYLKMYHSLV